MAKTLKERFEAFLNGEEELEEKDIKDDKDPGAALDDASEQELAEGEKDEAVNLEKIKEEYEQRIASLEQENQRLKDKAWNLFSKVKGEKEKPAEPTSEKEVKKESKELDDMFSVED